MNNQLIRTVEKYKMLEIGDKVIVALSGGADSVALLNALNSIKEKYSLTVFAAHINHGLRGAEADRDENFCKILCKNYNIQLFVKKSDVKALAKQQKISVELCGRNVRYGFFEELAKKFNAKIATAHTASDNAETLIYNITRGSGINGAGGIAPVRDNIIRPLIEVTRSQIEEYCKTHGLSYVTDSTNLTDDYTRNRLRHLVITELKNINPQFELAALHFSQSARETFQYIENQANAALNECKTAYGFDCKKLLSYDEVIVKSALSVICKTSANMVPEYRHLNLLLNILKDGGAVELSKQFTAVAKQNILRIVNTAKVEAFIEIPLNNSAEFCFDGKTYSAEYYNSNSENSTPVFRLRKSGDTFSLQKRNLKKPLRKLMNELKIPFEQRDKLVVLALGSKILWCEGIGFSSDGAALNNRQKLKIKINRKLGE